MFGCLEDPFSSKLKVFLIESIDNEECNSGFQFQSTNYKNQYKQIFSYDCYTIVTFRYLSSEEHVLYKTSRFVEMKKMYMYACVCVCVNYVGLNTVEFCFSVCCLIQGHFLCIRNKVTKRRFNKF